MTKKELEARVAELEDSVGELKEDLAAAETEVRRVFTAPEREWGGPDMLDANIDPTAFAFWVCRSQDYLRDGRLRLSPDRAMKWGADMVLLELEYWKFEAYYQRSRVRDAKGMARSLKAELEGRDDKS